MSPTAAAIGEAAAILRAGGLVVMPTETVYGLAADATNGTAVAALYATKQRPQFNPLIVHVASLAAARRLAVVLPLAEALAERLWPGPLTLVLPARPDNGITSLVTAGLDTIAIRVPAHPVAQALLAACERPLAAPSANRSGRVSPTTAAHVAADFAGLPDTNGAPIPILDGGPCGYGLESTILDAKLPGRLGLLRAGAVTMEAVAALTGVTPAGASGHHADRPAAPGQLASHYAPRAQVRLDAAEVAPGEALLAFGPAPLATAGPVVNLSPTGDLAEAARTLFAALRTLDATGALTIAVMPIPDHGLGVAIRDRLVRAAAPRPTPGPGTPAR